MRTVHKMPFGAELEGNGVRFCLWSPTSKRVALALAGRELQPMAIEDGWARLHVADAIAGNRYSFQVDDNLIVPDPASRFQPEGPSAPSMIVDPTDFEWSDEAWRGRPWEEAVIWEAHVGAATPQGSYRGLLDKLPQLVDLGVTAIELMPLSACAGSRNWGYDGVLPFAPVSTYGHPEDLKRLVARAHELGLMMILDVVYNHFGPSGNFLNAYAGAFFNEKHATPWGGAINFDGEHSRPVRDFFLHNALYWIEEYHFDGLRFDAVHAFVDKSEPRFLAELAERTRDLFRDREIHLILENEKNEARWLERREGRSRYYSAQWNDDWHHCWHRLLTGESEGYYEDFDEPAERLGRALAQGFVYQGEASAHQRGVLRGEPSAHLPPTAFINFLQNHDQVGNRALGDRLSTLAPAKRLGVAQAVLLLCPAIPMLFMGEEWGAKTPFLFFVDFSEDPALSKAVRDGRRQEFSRFAAFSDPERVPDPTRKETFLASRLDWSEAEREPHKSVRNRAAALLRLRSERVVPLLKSGFVSASNSLSDEGILDVCWRFISGDLRLLINFGEAAATIERAAQDSIVWLSDDARADPHAVWLPSWAAVVSTAVRP